MATYSRQQLVRRILTELTVLDANEAPEAEDFDLVNERAQQKLESLYEEGLIPFDIDSDIPARFFIPLAHIIAAESYLPFGAQHMADELMAGAQRGVSRLWRLRNKAYFSNPTQADYF
jgi:hypothetical protein